MPFAVLPVLHWLGSSFWSFASSRAGQIIIAFAVAWFWSGMKSDNYWQAQIAAENARREAAYQAEIIRQEEAAKEIARDATARAEEDAQVESDLRRQIEEFDKQEKSRAPSTPSCPSPDHYRCVVDDNFSNFVRKLDASNRTRKAPRRTR